MPEPMDLYRAAKIFLEQHGRERALAICEEKEQEFYVKGELLGLAAWRGIKSAILEMTKKPDPGTKLH